MKARAMLGAAYAVLAAAVLLGTGRPAAAQTTIDTKPLQNSTIFAFGEPDTATYGQTFTVGSDNVLNSFSFNLTKGAGAPTTSFQFYVMGWDGTKATGPVLFQSGVTTIASGTPMQAFTFNTGNLALTSGSQYVGFINASNQFDGSEDANVGMGSVTGASVYNGGAFVYLNNGNNFSRVTQDAWTTGFQGPGADAAFTAQFSSRSLATPEPTSLALALPGLMPMWLLVRRRRKQAA